MYKIRTLALSSSKNWVEAWMLKNWHIHPPMLEYFPLVSFISEGLINFFCFISLWISVFQFGQTSDYKVSKSFHISCQVSAGTSNDYLWQCYTTSWTQAISPQSVWNILAFDLESLEIINRWSRVTSKDNPTTELTTCGAETSRKPSQVLRM